MDTFSDRGVNQDGITNDDKFTMSRIRSDHELIGNGARYVGGVLRLCGWQVENLRYSDEEKLQMALDKSRNDYFENSADAKNLQKSIADKWKALAVELHPDIDFDNNHAIVSFLLNGTGTPIELQRKRIILETSGQAVVIGQQYVGRFGPRFTYGKPFSDRNGRISILEGRLDSTVEPLGQTLCVAGGDKTPLETELFFAGTSTRFNYHVFPDVVSMQALTETQLRNLDATMARVTVR